MKGEFKKQGEQRSRKNLKSIGNIYILNIIKIIANLENTSYFEKVSKNEVGLGR